MKLYIKKFAELSLNELYEIMKIRNEVFVVEQNCVYQDLDDKDQKAIHLFYKENEKIIAYLRVIEPGVAFTHCSIGRVLCIERRKGIASYLLDEAIHTAKEHFKATSIYLEAQVYARTLYEKKGFKAVTEEFMEDGIPHIGMLLEL